MGVVCVIWAFGRSPEYNQSLCDLCNGITIIKIDTFLCYFHPIQRNKFSLFWTQQWLHKSQEITLPAQSPEAAPVCVFYFPPSVYIANFPMCTLFTCLLKSPFTTNFSCFKPFLLYKKAHPRSYWIQKEYCTHYLSSNWPVCLVAYGKNPFS